MKIVVTGSLGNIGKPLTAQLIATGHQVTVVSSTMDREEEIEAMGANAAIGSLEDDKFLTRTFAGADAVYTMIPPNNYFDHSFDLDSYYQRLAGNYVKAVRLANVKRLVHLSTFGAHLKKGNGILSSAYEAEQILGKLNDVTITFLRPGSFYYNLFSFVHAIKAGGEIRTNYGSESIIPWVSPIDIANAVAEELNDLKSSGIRYVASEELSGADTAAILGAAIGKPDLKWQLASDSDVLNGLLEIGMNPQIAAGIVELQHALGTGLLAEDYVINKPDKLGEVKLADFAREFALRYNS